MAEAVEEGAPASNEAMEIQEDFFRNQVLTFKTPAKRKHTVEEETMEIRLNPYSPLFKDDKNLVLENISEVGGLLSRLDSSVADISKTLISFLSTYKNDSDQATVAVSSLWFQLESMSS